MFSLLWQKRFAPFFGSMVLGAFNDNLFKSSLAIMIAYGMVKERADLLVQASAGLFILPFFILSGISGQICDKFEKASIIRFTKWFEVVIMLMGAVGFFYENAAFLMFVLFLMGVHSTLFGPCKYSILPQHLKGHELLSGNGLTSMGTFLAILAGTILGGQLASKNMIESYGHWPIAIGIVAAASIGLFFAFFIPHAAPTNPQQQIEINPVKETWRTMKLAFINSHVRFAIFGISWFWFYGFFFMASLPSYCRDALAGDEVVASMLLTAISIGMGLGSVLCNKLSQGVIHLGLVVTSAFGLGIFGCDLYFNGITHQLPAGQYLSFTEFIAVPANWRALFDLMGIGVFGGMYIVPLYTLMQKHAPKVYASQIVASNNIWNALFMVSAALVAMLLFALKLTILQIFLVVASVNFFIALYLLIKGPQHFYLIMFNVLFRAIYRIKVKGREYLPDSGPVLVVANHVSFIDPLLLCAALDRPPRFMMDKSYYDWKILRWFFTTSRSIPVTPKKIDPQLMEWALQQVVDGLNRGEMIAIFPEGFITKDGEMIDFKDGLERIAQKVPELKVVPVAIKGMWGSWFSRYSGRALKGRAPKRFWAKLEIEIGQTHQGPAIQAQALQKTVRDLRGNFL